MIVKTSKQIYLDVDYEHYFPREDNNSIHDVRWVSAADFSIRLRMIMDFTGSNIYKVNRKLWEETLKELEE